MTGILPKMDHASCLAGLASVSTAGPVRSSSSSSAAAAGPTGIRIDDQARTRQNLVHEPDAEADGSPRLTGEPVAQQRDAGLAGGGPHPAPRRDDGKRQVALACRAQSGEGLRRLPGMAGSDDQRPWSGAGRQPVVAVHQQRHAQPLPGNCRHQLGADRRPTHGEHDDMVHIGVAIVEAQRRTQSSGFRELTRQVHDPPEHVLRVDPLAGRRVVQGDGLLEQRRTLVVAVALGRRIGTPGLFVRVLVAEVVAGIHAYVAPAMTRPSESSVSTSPGERASA